LLDGCRVLDLTDENGLLCGKILADLGADVIKVEKPGGDPARRLGPFYKDEAEPEKSLYWFAYNTNKRGITLDLDKPEARRIFLELVRTADVVVESFPPGWLDKRGLGYDGLKAVKADIILTSITAFGQSGPYREHKTSDIVTMGMTGILYQTGDRDTPPVHMSMAQSPMHAGADAAVGTLLAYYHREMTGEGQQVDVSQQQSAAWFLANAVPLYELNGVVLQRSGAMRWSLTSTQRQVWECQDGYVFFNIIGGRGGAKTLRELVSWMDGEGMATDHLKAMDWENFDVFKAGQEDIDTISAPIEAFFKAHTREEVSTGAAARSISICPLSSMEHLRNDPQLASRDFWKDISHPELNAHVTYPREFVKATGGHFETNTRAPLIGEHNGEIYRELGFSADELDAMQREGII
jgi:crotonobetainyl-CoA:carnitine CoA-transferase CaiB-like acyl-CoA transferase